MTKMTAEQVVADLASQIIGVDTVWGHANDSALRESIRLIRDHLIETDEQRRERFESWHRKRYGPSFDHMLARDWHGYANGGTNMMWLAFHAALTWRGETKGGE